VLVEPLIPQRGHGTDASLGQASREVHSPGNDRRDRRETTWVPRVIRAMVARQAQEDLDMVLATRPQGLTAYR